ncbi:hypothetical protein [Schlesneria paludicola]|uniref:hypothetical protein n=1 Tax=Schlesneria paludicola TaxID=360056 RepID=UPI00029B501C|nr:hypothetical protein [Schlesneria paludicola]
MGSTVLPPPQDAEDAMIQTCQNYISFYKQYAIDWWNHIGPVEYVVLLSLVGIIGYVSMLKGNKRIA